MKAAVVRSRRLHALALLVLALLVAGLYARTLDDPFHFDDLGELTSTVRQAAPRVASDHYRGIVVLWLWAWNHRAGGEDPAIYHATNVALHAGAVACLYWLAWLVLPAGRARRGAALAAAAIFAAHPLATQSVAYITQRSTSAAALLFLAAVAAWIAGRRARGAARWACFGVALAAHALGLWTKHVGILVPAAVLLYEFLFEAPPRRRALALLIPFVLLSAFRAAQYAPRLERTTPQFRTAEEARILPRLPRTVYAISQPRSVLAYARLFVWPRGQNIDADYPPVRSAASPAAWGPALVLLAAAVAAGRVRRRQPVVTLGAGVFFLALVPTSTVVPGPDVFFEHRAYLPMAGLCLALGAAVAAGAARRPRAAGLAVVAVVLALSTATARRLAVWDSDLALWGDAVRKSPAKARPHINYALALQAAGRLDEAEAHYRRGLELRPDYPFALNNLANVLRRSGRRDEAQRLLERSIEFRPGYVSPRLNLGNLAMDRGDPGAAEAWYREAIALAPTVSEAHYNLAKALERQGRLAEAIGAYARAAELRPREALYANDLGCARLAAGDLAAAEADLLGATALGPEWEVPWYNLGLVRKAAGRPDEARAAFDRALALAPDLAPAREQRDALDP